MASVSGGGASEYAQVCDRLIDILSASKQPRQAESAKNPQTEVIGGVIVELLRYLERLEESDRGRETAKKRQADGIAAARARGVKYGRPVKKAPDNFIVLAEQWECGKLSIGEFMKQTGLKERTLYRRLQEYKITKRKQHQGKQENKD